MILSKYDFMIYANMADSGLPMHPHSIIRDYIAINKIYGPFFFFFFFVE